MDDAVLVHEAEAFRNLAGEVGDLALPETVERPWAPEARIERAGGLWRDGCSMFTGSRSDHAAREA